MKNQRVVFLIIAVSILLTHAVFAQDTAKPYSIEEASLSPKQQIESYYLFLFNRLRDRLQSGVINQTEFDRENERLDVEREKALEKLNIQASPATPANLPAATTKSAVANQSNASSDSYVIPVLTESGQIEKIDIAKITDPAKLIFTLFQFAMGAAGILAMGMIVFGGIQYTVSAGNPAMQKDARDRILNAVYGIALLLGSYLILNTINPEIVKISNPEVQSVNIKLDQKLIDKLSLSILNESKKLTNKDQIENTLKAKLNDAESATQIGRENLRAGKISQAEFDSLFKTEQQLRTNWAIADGERLATAVETQKQNLERDKLYLDKALRSGTISEIERARRAYEESKRGYDQLDVQLESALKNAVSQKQTNDQIKNQSGFK